MISLLNINIHLYVFHLDLCNVYKTDKIVYNVLNISCTIVSIRTETPSKLKSFRSTYIVYKYFVGKYLYKQRPKSKIILVDIYRYSICKYLF